MARQMVINSLTGQECRIVILNDSVMEELYVERASSASRVGNIYKGRVTNIEPSIQAAFIDFGLYKNGFLHVSDLSSEYFPKGKGSGHEGVGRKHPHRDRPPIQDCLKRGQEVVVQMTKEGIGTKGPTMTTYLSIPGRLLVMMPGMKRLGVSRKVEDEEVRARAKDALSQLDLPSGMGFIVRTAGVDRPKREMHRDLNYLLRLWTSTSELIRTAKAPSEIYQESDLVIRTLRDAYSTDISRIVCDNPEVAVRVRDFLKVATPRAKTMIEVYTGTEGLFHDTGLDGEIDKINSRRVDLPSGGSLVIDPTEALVAVDVNSGRSRGHSDAEATALNTNLEAAQAIGRQLRMRDLGGVIVIDFIDMRDEKHRRAVERELKDVMKGDRAKNRILRISSFGILQMTRQRLGPPLKHSYYRNCPQCDGLGMIKSEESQALVVMRLLSKASANEDIAEINITCPPPVAHYLANYQRKDIILIEEKTAKTIVITADSEMTGDDVQIECINARGSKVTGETGKHKQGKLKTVKLEAFLTEQAKQAGKSPSAKPTDAEQQTDDDSAKLSSSQKRSRRRRSSAAKKAAETKDATDAQTDKPAKKTTDKPAKTTKTEKKTTDKPAKIDKKKIDEPAKTAKSGKHRRRTSSKRTTRKTDEGAAHKASTTESAKKTSKRAKKSKSARRKLSRREPARDQKTSDDELPEVTPPSQLREEIETRRLEQQKDKPPQKTLLEAMGFDNNADE